MDHSHHDPEYVARVDSAFDAMHCPDCGAKAHLMALSWNSTHGSYVVSPVFCCNTPECEFSVDSEAAWTPVLMP